MIKKQLIGDELYVFIFCPIKRKWDLLYKRWLSLGYGKVMDRIPFTAKEIDAQKADPNPKPSSGDPDILIDPNLVIFD